MNELHEIGCNAKSEDLPNGVKLTVLASEAQPLTELKVLGFMGIMVQGEPSAASSNDGNESVSNALNATFVGQTETKANRWL